jgi:hypothetical protein
VLSPGTALHRRDLRVIPPQIQSPDQLPNRTHGVLLLYQLLYIHRSQEKLPAINRHKSGNSGLVVAHARSLHNATPSDVNFFTRSCPPCPPERAFFGSEEQK